MNGSIAARIQHFDDTVDSALQHARGIRALDTSSVLLTKLADYGLAWAFIGAVRAVARPLTRRNTVHAILFTSMAAPSLNWPLKFIVARPRPYETGPPGEPDPQTDSSPRPSGNLESSEKSGNSGKPTSPAEPNQQNRETVIITRYGQPVAKLVPAEMHSAPRRESPAHAEPELREISYRVRTPGSPSFPSGHTLTAWCAATVLAAGDPLGPAYYLLAAAISYSRIHLRHHYATDVIGGMAMGIALGHIGRRVALNERGHNPLP
ncbi:MAG: phosphatase PAP2 family protein [Acidimicrobiales bacterium]